MTHDAKILNTITTITFVDSVPRGNQATLYISLSFAFAGNMIDYGFLSGYGIKWLAQIIYVFDVDCLERVQDEMLIVETDDDERIIKVGSKKTGTFFGELKSREGKSGEVNMEDWERFEIGRWKK